MKKSTIIMMVSIVLAIALGVGGTLAYLADTDADVNTMTLGNVKIVQNEQEWVLDEEGNRTGLQQFTQDKPLMPYVGEMGWETVGNYGDEYRAFTMNNVVDKYVTVTNIGKSDAYVRTIFAFEMGSVPYEEFKQIGVSINKVDGAEFDYPGTWEWTEDYVAEIDGKMYNIMVAEHQNPLKPGETTIPSLLQVYLSKDATNEDVLALDGNGNGKYDILVISQAVQAQGFSDANTALSSAFAYGDDKALTAASWFESIGEEGGIEVGSPGDKHFDNNPPEFIMNFEELKAACRYGGNYKLGADICITEADAPFYGAYVTAVYKDTTLDLNGHTITIDRKTNDVLFYVYDTGASLTMVGDGNVVAKNNAFIFFTRSVCEGLYIYGGNYYNIDESSGSNNDINAICYTQLNKNNHIYGGTFTFKNVNGHCGGFNVYDNSGGEIILHEGVLLSNSNYYKGSDGDEIHLAEGCTLQEVVIDGVTWYQVVKE